MNNRRSSYDVHSTPKVPNFLKSTTKKSATPSINRLSSLGKTNQDHFSKSSFIDTSWRQWKRPMNPSTPKTPTIPQRSNSNFNTIIQELNQASSHSNKAQSVNTPSIPRNKPPIPPNPSRVYTPNIPRTTIPNSTSQSKAFQDNVSNTLKADLNFNATDNRSSRYLLHLK